MNQSTELSVCCLVREPLHLVNSFDEQCFMCFEDSALIETLAEGVQLFGHEADMMIADLYADCMAIKDYPDPKTFIDDPRMEAIRQKARKALGLMLAAKPEHAHPNVEFLEQKALTDEVVERFLSDIPGGFAVQMEQRFG